MMELWAVAVQEVRAALDGGWRARPVDPVAPPLPSR